MKFKITLLLNIFLVFITSCSNEKILKLPITFQEGYGPFEPAMRAIYSYSDDDPWEKTQLKVSGIPKNWTDIKIGDINTDIYQSVYQNYYSGNISNAKYKEFQKSRNWKPDSTSLSKKPIKCKIAFAYGKDSLGTLKMIVDANNNLDFDDDNIFKPIGINPPNKINHDSLLKTNAIKVDFERFSNDKTTQISVPVLIVYMEQYNMFMYNFAQYATTKLNGEEIAILSNNFTDLSYRNLGIIKINNERDKAKKINSLKTISKNGYLETENKIYKNLGVKKNENVLVLEKMDLPKNQLHSTQIGFKAFDFSANQFKSQTSISLNSLKGRYVLLDFWATWCGPCIKEIPNLKDIYENIDRSKFEIIGIVCQSPVKSLEEMIEKHAISWPQIISNDSNKIKEKYEIYGYPTTFLINPEGVIIAKNLRGKELEYKITNLINE